MCWGDLENFCAIYALYPENFCDKNLAIRKVFAFCDSECVFWTQGPGLFLFPRQSNVAFASAVLQLSYKCQKLCSKYRLWIIFATNFILQRKEMCCFLGTFHHPCHPWVKVKLFWIISTKYSVDKKVKLRRKTMFGIWSSGSSLAEYI